MSNNATRFDPHELLGVSASATPEEIKREYRRMARLLHPDMHSGQPDEVKASAARMFRMVDEAHRVLLGSKPQNMARTSASPPSDQVADSLVVNPRSHRAQGVTPGTPVAMTLRLTPSGFRPAGEPTISAPGHGVATTISRASLTDTGIEVRLLVDTTKLGANRSYDIPLLVRWGNQLGTVHLRIETGELETWNPAREQPHPDAAGPRRWPYPRMPRWRQVIYALYAGFVLPVLGLAWSMERLGTPPQSPGLVVTGSVLLLALFGYTMVKTGILAHTGSLGLWGTWGGAGLIGLGFLALWVSVIAGAVALLIAIVMALLGILIVVAVIAVFVSMLNG